MADFMTTEQRSRAMSRVRGEETRIEQAVRSLLYKRGFRFRKNVSNLPGRPDVVLPKYKAVIFVHGCFWHGHSGCKRSVLPETRAEFWQSKIGRTVERDRKNIDALMASGWHVAVVWQCALISKHLLSDSIDTLADWIISDQLWLEIPCLSNT